VPTLTNELVPPDESNNTELFGAVLTIVKFGYAVRTDIPPAPVNIGVIFGAELVIVILDVLSVIPIAAPGVSPLTAIIGPIPSLTNELVPPDESSNTELFGAVLTIVKFGYVVKTDIPPAPVSIGVMFGAELVIVILDVLSVIPIDAPGVSPFTAIIGPIASLTNELVPPDESSNTELFGAVLMIVKFGYVVRTDIPPAPVNIGVIFGAEFVIVKLDVLSVIPIDAPGVSPLTAIIGPTASLTNELVPPDESNNTELFGAVLMIVKFGYAVRTDIPPAPVSIGVILGRVFTIVKFGYADNTNIPLLPVNIGVMFGAELVIVKLDVLSVIPIAAPGVSPFTAIIGPIPSLTNELVPPDESNNTELFGAVLTIVKFGYVVSTDIPPAPVSIGVMLGD
jgi:hypothetical protein